LGKGGRSSNNNQTGKRSNVRQAAKKANLANKTRPTNQNRAGLRPRVQPGKAKTTFKSAKAPQGKLKSPAKKLTNQNKGKAISQALALKRLNKARATLQKAVKAVDDANKNLARTMPTVQKKKPTPKQSRSNSIARGRNTSANQNQRKRPNNQLTNQNARRAGGKIQKRNRNIARGDVAVKFNNRGPSGRGRGKVNVVRDTLKKEKPATSLDDRFSQLLKNAARSTNRGGARGGRGGARAQGTRGRGSGIKGRRNNQSGGRNQSSNRRRF